MTRGIKHEIDLWQQAMSSQFLKYNVEDYILE